MDRIAVLGAGSWGGTLSFLLAKKGYPVSLWVWDTEQAKVQFNRVVQARRQPGSAFKAFVYTAAIDNGYDPEYQISNKPIEYKGKPWPKNYSPRQSRGSYTIKAAVAGSVNRCAVNMADQLGIDEVIKYARLLGIKSDLDPTLSLALGASVVTPLEICAAYGVFAADGVRAEPMCIVRITRSEAHGDGALLEDNKPRTVRVLSEQTAELMNTIFRAVVIGRGGTGYAAARVPNSHGKTGTTSDDRDAWFLGYTPELVTAVWVGNDDYRKPMKSVWGGNVCAPAWSAFMLKALKIREKENKGQLPAAVSEKDENGSRETERERRRSERRDDSSGGLKSISICSESGVMATSACPSKYTIRVRPGNEPSGFCTIHSSRETYGNAEEAAPPVDATEYDTAEPSPEPETSNVTPPRHTNEGHSDQYATVTLCVESGNIATAYCPQTIQRRYPAGEIPRRACRVHRPPSE